MVKMAKIDTKHKLYNKWLPVWQKVRASAEGQESIKKGGETYLKKLNGQDATSYQNYLDRAQFTNFTGRTIEIAKGQLFRKNPIIEGLEEEEIANIDLEGQSLFYFSKNMTSEVMTNNRYGVLVDYSDILNRPYLTTYKAEEIINWKTEIVNGVKSLVLVVLEGMTDMSDDLFETNEEQIWRVLSLEDNTYYVREYIKGDKTKDEYLLLNEYIPLMNGKPLDYIPFFPITSNGVDTNITNARMLDFANVNLGHYKNSADFENMLHWTGAKTIYTKGFGNNVVPLGGSFDLPVDGDAGVLEASSDSGLKDEMKHKEEQMAAMGTSLISGRGRYVQSAETSTIQSQGEYATLADIATSLSDAMTKVLKVFAEWAGRDNKDVAIEYNKDYELSKIDPQSLTAYIGAVQGGYMSYETFFYNMKNKEIYPEGWTLEDEMEAIQKGQEQLVIEEEPEQGQVNELE